MMTNKSLGQPLYRYATVNNLTLDTYGEKCLDFSYANMINELKKTEWNSSAGEGGKGVNVTIETVIPEKGFEML